MSDNESLSYESNCNAIVAGSERVLITLERAQKLDLLIHLAANLRQSLIVCGPDGIGKTTLLRTFQQGKEDVWGVSLLSGSSQSNFDSILQQFATELAQRHSGGDNRLLPDLLTELDQQRRKAVLMIDDAGALEPGLITRLDQYAAAMPAMRLVLTMTYDDFHIKIGTDAVVESCHVIDIPPLSKKQCGNYLQNLTAQSGAVLSFQAVTEHLIDHLFRLTHGVPGKILEELPKLTAYQVKRQNRLGFSLVGFACMAGLIGWGAERYFGNHDAPAVAPIVDGLVADMPALPIATPPPSVENQSDTAMQYPLPIASGIQSQVPDGDTLMADAARSSVAPVVESAVKEVPAEAISDPVAERPEVPAVSANKPSAVEQPAKSAVIEPFSESNSEAHIAWIDAQPDSHYTLQLMVLSQKTSALRLLRKYPDHRDGLRFYPLNRSGQEKYVIIYGSFDNAVDALKRKQTLPAELSGGLEKKFKAIKKEIKRS